MLWWYYSKNSVQCHPLRNKLSLKPVFRFSTKRNDYMIPVVDLAAGNFSPKPRITSLQVTITCAQSLRRKRTHAIGTLEQQAA